jgi:octaprenyl-diphosphate synthase
LTAARTVGSRPSPLPPAALVADELELVERRIAALIESREPKLTDIAGHLIHSGGKRVRPGVVLLVFRACGGTEVDDVVDVAVALELIHSASLLHDDIIDDGRVRRGRDSALSRYGVAQTLVTGDFLFSRAFQICGRFDESLIRLAAEACVALTEGEIMQGRFRHNPDVTLADYLEIIARKTASLFEVGAHTAARLAGAPPRLVDAMARSGLHVGLTFQMIDDLLDVTAAEGKIGKPVGLDLREGNPSLPIVLSLGDADVQRWFQQSTLSEADSKLFVERVRSPRVLAEGRRMAAEHAARAAEALHELPESPHRDTLLSLIDQLLERPA